MDIKKNIVEVRRVAVSVVDDNIVKRAFVSTCL